MSEIELPGIIEQIKEPPLSVPKWRFFLVAYWPRDARWKILPETYSDPKCQAIRDKSTMLHGTGWTRVTVLELPAGLWEDAKPSNLTTSSASAPTITQTNTHHERTTN